VTTTLVTGAGGFVGRHVVRALAALGEDVIAILRPGSVIPDWGVAPDLVRVERCDLADAEAVATVVGDIRPDAIANLAIDRSMDTTRAAMVNVRGFAALLDAAEACGAYVAHAGSSTEYGVHDQPLTSTTTCIPESALGITKLQAHENLVQRVSDGTVNAVTLRLFHVYGPGEPERRLVPMALNAARTGAPLPLTDATPGHDLIHVTDATAAILAAIGTGRSQPRPINVCTGRSTTNHEVVDIIERVVGTPVDRRVGAFTARAWDHSIWTADPAEFIDLIGRSPLDLETGIQRTIADRFPAATA
jgi:nucleoside-diphosphate-sugar epimerase